MRSISISNVNKFRQIEKKCLLLQETSNLQIDTVYVKLCSVASSENMTPQNQRHFEKWPLKFKKAI